MRCPPPRRLRPKLTRTPPRRTFSPAPPTTSKPTTPTPSKSSSRRTGSRKRPDLLYNISVCYERLGRWDDAIGSLQQYLTERPEAPDRAVIESRIANYEQRRDQEKARAAAPPPVATAPPPPIAPAPRRHVASWIVGGIGAGLLVAALGTGVTAHLTYNDLDDEVRRPSATGDQTLRDEASFGRALTISTDVLIAVGGATLATGDHLVHRRGAQEAGAAVAMRGCRRRRAACKCSSKEDRMRNFAFASLVVVAAFIGACSAVDDFSKFTFIDGGAVDTDMGSGLPGFGQACVDTLRRRPRRRRIRSCASA